MSVQNLPILNFFFDGLNTLKQEEADTCEGLLTLEECTKLLKQFMNNKTPGSDGLTIEFYRFFWNAIGPIMVDSFKYAFENGQMSISQKRGVISLIPKKDKDKKYLKNWRPVSLLSNDYKIVTKALALRLEGVLPTIISPNQTGYVKGRYIGESIRILTDIMSISKKKNIPGLIVFLDFEKAFDSIEWCYLQKCLEAFNFGPQLRQSIKVLYNNISSCVLSNGFATKHFNLSRGVRQGCPFSGILFVIGVEILSNAIKRSKEIEGIQIDPNKSIKITQYADDTTVFVKDIRSVHRLFDLLQQFENCSGLRINQSKSEILWLGSLRQRKDSILELKLSDETVYGLGVYFSYDEELATKRNFFEKLPTLKKILNIWSSRDISIYGRVNIVKTLAISKLTFICSVLDTPKGFSDEVNNIIFDYIWNFKNPKRKNTTIIKNKKDGGLNMIDFTLFDNALKIVWVKRLCANDERPWKFISLSLLSNVGGSLLFQYSYNIQYLPLNENLPKFYRDIISYWQKIKNTNPKTKRDVLNQTIWNNQFIRVNKSSVFFPGWNKVGIEKLSCLFDNESNTMMSFSTFMHKYNIKSNFLQYYSLLSAIPQEWKTMLKQECSLPSTEYVSFSIEKLTCKIIYNTLLNYQHFLPPTAEKRLIEYGFNFLERQKIYSLPFRVTNEVRLSVFQYKIVHNILYTNKILYKMKKKQQPDCCYCHGIDQMPLHLFVECSIAKLFWNNFTNWYNATCGGNIALEQNEIIYGVFRHISSCLTLNHLIIIGKYFLYINGAHDEERPQFTDFVNLVYEKIELQKYITITTKKLLSFTKKWSNFLSI